MPVAKIEREREGNETALARWSRRKLAAARGDGPAVRPELPPAATDRSSACGAQPPLALPDPDTLDLAGDFAAFLRDGVDPLIRRTALRRLWRLDPAFSELDGLVEYGADYTDATRTPAAVRTAFRFVGDVLTLADRDEPPATPNSAEMPADPEDDAGALEGSGDTVEPAEDRASRNDEPQRS